MDDELDKLIADARKAYEALTPAERDELSRQQAASWVRAEMSWPAPKFEWVNGVKVYASFEDYCNG